MNAEHASAALITRYVRGEELAGDAVWALESHLETCADCRGRLAEVDTPGTLTALESVWSRLEPELARTTPARHRRAAWLSTWVTPVMLPWLLMALLVVVAAVAMDRLWQGEDGISFVRLFAPILPVLGVAAAWTRGVDPAYELTAATPRAGLYLVLRRTAAVLVVVFPLLLLAQWVTGGSIAMSLLPSLAFTTGTLALGGVIDMAKAAYTLIGIWSVIVIAPTVTYQRETFLFSEAWLPMWAAALAVTAIVIVLRRGAFTRLSARRA
ncbi:zf-HC2 domain-containing protein [Amycolatopsis sp. NPDC059021]|uniref:zf-HC2 domain-containing protein n=1 Tax=Amycolatopsis sp. NPDC059021 TaxID=3346704 RepID=UPI00366F24CB